MTYKELLAFGEKNLTESKIEEATLDAYWLLEYRTGFTRSDLFLHGNEVVENNQVEKYMEDIEKRKHRIPLQHITGVQEFMGLPFKVDENVLIPRQDTECLVEEVIEKLQPDMSVLDMCTGSGCIIISLAEYAKRKKIENISFCGVDISEKALNIAKKNAFDIGVNVRFLESDLFEKIEEKYDIIVSNPPYIRTEVIGQLQDEVKLHDPWIALDGKENGLFFYQNIIKESKRYLKKRGYLMFEIGFDQREAVIDLMKAEGFHGIVSKKDLAGLDRIVIGVYN